MFGKKHRIFRISKFVKAVPMTRLEYNDLRGWTLPADENGSDEGFLITNVETGDRTWTPKEEFNSVHQEDGTGMNFGMAIDAMKAGLKVARKSWNGKNMFVVYMSGMSLPPFNTQGTDRKVNDRTAKFIGEDKPLNSQPYLAMYNAQEEWIPGWSATQSDMLGNDWYVAN